MSSINETPFQDKTAFVTGAASGIVLAVARSFCSRGTSVMMADIDHDALQMAAVSLRDEGAIVDTVICDVAKDQDIQRSAEKTISRFGKVHFVVNNAGVSLGGVTGEIPLDDWRWIVDINLMGVVYGTEIFTPLIKKHGEGGHIVNTASMAGHWGVPTMGPYNATKFAVVGYSESLRQELAEHNIGVSALCPGWIATNIYKSGKDRPSVVNGKNADIAPQALEHVAALVDNGFPASVVGELVAESIVENRAAIFTHEDMKLAMGARAEALLQDYQSCLDSPTLNGM